MGGLSGATISAPLGCRGLPSGAVGGKAGRAEDERWRRASASGRRLGGGTVRCVATEKHGEKAGVAVGVEFADEEDYRKAGGGEQLFVQMQATKPMESQSMIGSKVILITTADSIPSLSLIVSFPEFLGMLFINDHDDYRLPFPFDS
jgi:lycopene epsilon-cyclase